MKRYFIVLIIIFFISLSASARMSQLFFAGQQPTSSVCNATEDLGNIGSETWDTDSGTDESWVNATVSPGCTRNWDYDVSSIGCGFIDEGLYSETDGDASDNAYTYKNYGTEYPVFYVRAYFYVDTSNEVTGQTDNFLRWNNSTGSWIVAVEWGKDGSGNWITKLKMNSDLDTVQTSLDTVYRVEVYGNVTLDEWAWKVFELQGDGVTFSLLDEDSGSGFTGYGSSIGEPTDGIQTAIAGWQGQDKATIVIIDNVDFDTTGWIGE